MLNLSLVKVYSVTTDYKEISDNWLIALKIVQEQKLLSENSVKKYTLGM